MKKLFQTIRGLQGYYPWVIFIFFLGIIFTILGIFALSTANTSYASIFGNLRPFIILSPVIFIILYAIIGIRFQKRILHESIMYIMGCYLGAKISLVIGGVILVVTAIRVLLNVL